MCWALLAGKAKALRAAILKFTNAFCCSAWKRNGVLNIQCGKHSGSGKRVDVPAATSYDTRIRATGRIWRVRRGTEINMKSRQQKTQSNDRTASEIWNRISVFEASAATAPSNLPPGTSPGKHLISYRRNPAFLWQPRCKPRFTTADFPADVRFIGPKTLSKHQQGRTQKLNRLRFYDNRRGNTETHIFFNADLVDSTLPSHSFTMPSRIIVFGITLIMKICNELQKVMIYNNRYRNW